MDAFGDNLNHLLGVTVATVTKLLVVLWRQDKARREIRELRRLLQEETEKRERLQNQVHRLWDKVNRKD